MSEDSMAVYQSRGDLLSGVYGYGHSAASVQTLTLHAAEQSADALKKYVAASAATPGLTA